MKCRCRSFFQEGRPPPSDLSAGEKRTWRETVPELLATGLLAKADRRLLKAYCVQVAFIDEATGVIRDDGLMTTGSTGQRRQHPLITARDRATTVVRGLAETLGIGPAARERHNIKPPMGPQQLAEMLERELGAKLRPVSNGGGAP